MVLLALALMAIALGTAVPALTTQIRRDKETEMIHRGEQYARAVRRYYKKFGRYPSRLEELENTNNIRFLRKRYKDPMSPSGNWRVLHVGDVKIGVAGSTGNLTPVAQGAQSGQSPSPSPFGSGGTPSAGTMGTQTTGAGTTNAGSPSFGGQVFGGGPIIGVASMVEKRGIHEFNNKPNYKDWNFVYDPSQDRGGLIKGPYNPNAFVGQGGSGMGTPAGSNLPNIPGVSGQGGLFGGPQPNTNTPTH